MVNILNFVFILLRPVGFVYGRLMRLRALLFCRNFLKRTSFEAPVISVGNLAMGGSGKTPVVMYLANLLQKQGYRPAVVSRGYGGRAKNDVNIVSDGTRILLDSKEAGDEPRFIAESLSGTCVVTGTKRAAPCRYALQQLDCSIIILDDGFQHMAVRRDLDLVLFSASALYENMHVFPGGLLREPLSALERASCFVITGCSEENSKKVDQFSHYLRTKWAETPLFLSRFEPRCFVDSGGRSFSLQHITAPVLAFCGIASPLRFRSSLEQVGVGLAAFRSFKDHMNYTGDTLVMLERQARLCGAKALLTTEKDLVKLAEADISLPLYALSMKMEIDPAFDDYLISQLHSADIVIAEEDPCS